MNIHVTYGAAGNEQRIKVLGAGLKLGILYLGTLAVLENFQIKKLNDKIAKLEQERKS